MRSLRNTSLLVVSFSALVSSAQWVAEPDVPTAPFDGGFAFTLNGKIHVGAGDDLFAYDPVTSTWQTRADFPGEGDDRGWSSAFVIGNTAYVGLGITTGNIFRTDLHAYDPVSDTWSSRASFPGAARGGCAVFVLNNKAYICGGTSTGPTFSDVYCYDPAADTWTLVSTLPTGTRGFATGFAIGNYGYVYGGYFGFGNETAALNRYDPVANTWTAMASMPGGGRQSAIGLVIGGKALVGLGHAGFTTGYNSFYLYDPATNAWTAAGTFNGGNRICPVAAVYDQTAYVGSGYDLNFSATNDWWSNSGFVGVQGLERPAMDLVIAPVPATDVLTITRTRPDVGIIELLDPTGSVVMTSTAVGRTLQLDISSLDAGSYLVRSVDTDGRTVVRKFIKL